MTNTERYWEDRYWLDPSGTVSIIDRKTADDTTYAYFLYDPLATAIQVTWSHSFEREQDEDEEARYIEKVEIIPDGKWNMVPARQLFDEPPGHIIQARGWGFVPKPGARWREVDYTAYHDVFPAFPIHRNTWFVTPTIWEAFVTSTITQPRHN